MSIDTYRSKIQETRSSRDNAIRFGDGLQASNLRNKAIEAMRERKAQRQAAIAGLKA